jgi:hypothetical protein
MLKTWLVEGCHGAPRRETNGWELAVLESMVDTKELELLVDILLLLLGISGNIDGSGHDESIVWG